MNNHQTINDQRPTTNLDRPWPHRLAWIVACGVFPLIWMGGLVTTYGAGMAVPDWPTTYESWFYPLQKWIWKISTDLFLEHGHRTIAQLVGLASIFLLVAVFRSERRKTVRWLAIIILGGLLFQGFLGGYRVLWDERLLARIHGCTAPIVFCLCTLMVSLTSKTWQLCPFSMGEGQGLRAASRPMLWLTPFLAGLIYLEIVFGTLLRHPLLDAWTNWSLFWVWSKVITVGILAAGLIYLLLIAGKESFLVSMLRRRIFVLLLLFLLQVILACTTWVANYGWPKWFTDTLINWNYTVVRGGVLQIWITTAHAAVGSLVLVAAINLADWSWRLLRGSKC
jgi:cytochrome c oxidase assembly protein subunit 15